MNSETTRSLSRIIHQTLRHCESQRLVDYDDVPLTAAFVDEVGSEMVDLFERRILELKRKTPPGGPGASSGWFDGKASRQRGRG